MKILQEVQLRDLATRVPGSTRLATVLVGISLLLQGGASQAQEYASNRDTTPLIKTNVRRVVVDVVVTDKAGRSVSSLTKKDFSVAEDGRPQQVLFFEANGFSPAMDYLPPKLPPQPLNTFVNLPATPEKGPLYVLLFDLVNMDPWMMQSGPSDFSVQMFARQQMMKFIQSKPEGARFAVFVRSDGLHLVQGFTSDKALLLATLSPDGPKPVIPKVFMMAQNYGKENAFAALRTLGAIASYLDGLPGRKNLIWFSGNFPLVLLPGDDNAAQSIEETRKTLDLMAQDQIAIYPVDASGVFIGDPHAPSAVIGSGGMTADGLGNMATAGSGKDGGTGFSLTYASYATQKEIAQATGGREFHSNNGVAGMLLDATEDGMSYYTLTYAPTNKDYNGKPRIIQVNLAKKGYTLSYRRAYFGSDTETPILSPPKSQAKAPPPPRKLGDTLYANMERGAPIAHQLIFGAHLRTIGLPAMGTAEQMAELATQTGYFKVRRRTRQPIPLAPVMLQRYAIDYSVKTPQLQTSGEPVNLELAVAAYDTDGRMLNADVGNGAPEAGSVASGQTPPSSYRAELQLDVPLDAVWIRFAIRDANTNHIGAMETKLPLAPEDEAASAATKPD